MEIESQFCKLSLKAVPNPGFEISRDAQDTINFLVIAKRTVIIVANRDGFLSAHYEKAVQDLEGELVFLLKDKEQFDKVMLLVEDSAKSPVFVEHLRVGPQKNESKREP